MNTISPSPVLSGRGIVKRFPGVLALDRVDFDLHAGEVHGLIGEDLGISDRIMVMCEGRKTAEFHREQATEESLMQSAVPGFHAEAMTHA
jgi:ABC-type sugar transport system ATPase subunit